jgi:flagellar basal-body rod modification protein FlgD
MTLLVTQLKNQDPLNPLDNAQVTSQLAQLQTVTGVNKLNETLNTLKASYQSTEAMQATNLIGHGVLVEGSDVTLSGSKAIMGAELASDVDSLKIVISDKNGKEVQTMDLGAQKAGVIPLAWDGVPDATKLDSNGKPVTLADGDYTFQVVATKGGDKGERRQGAGLRQRGLGHHQQPDGVKLNLPSKGGVTLADIKQVL